MKNIIIIGNGEINKDIRKKVEQADIVVRFNHPQHNPDFVGTKTDYLFLVNSGSCLQRDIKKGLLRNIFYINSKSIVLPWSPLAIEKLLPKPSLLKKIRYFFTFKKFDNTYFAVKKLTSNEKKVKILPYDFNFSCYKELEKSHLKNFKRMPSTGFVGIYFFYKKYPDSNIEIYGFNWQGWNGHYWEEEQEWVQNNIHFTQSPVSNTALDSPT